jgi:hypothetical protein
MPKWLKKLLGKTDQPRLRRFEVVYREQVWGSTDKEAARHVINKLRNQQVELMVKQFTSKEGDDDKAILTFVKTEELLTIEQEFTKTTTTKTRL